MYQETTYHLNRTHSSGGIGNRIALINLNESATKYDSREEAIEAIETFKRSNHHQKVEDENFNIIEL